MFIDAKKAHLNPECESDVYIQLPEEAGCPEGYCGNLNFWLYGFRPAAAAWEKITDQIGRENQIKLYKASLGL